MPLRTYLPSLYGGGVSAQSAYGMVERAEQFAAWWLYRMGDRREMMTCDARLVACAQKHADYLASREDTTPSMHIGIDNSTPNERVIAAGYRLPDYYPEQGNQVESCAVNYPTVNLTVDNLLLSAGHRVHLLGEGWFAGHTVYGIGSSGPYYVCLIAPPEN